MSNRYNDQETLKVDKYQNEVLYMKVSGWIESEVSEVYEDISFR